MKLCVDGFGNPMKGYDWFIRGEMRSSKNKAAADLRELKAKLKELEKVTKQRDDLLAAMKKAREEMSCANFNSAAERIDHAIVSVKGGAA